MGSSIKKLGRAQTAVLTFCVGWAVVAFLPATGDVQLAGVSLTAWLLVAYLFGVPAVSLLTPDEQDD